MAWLLLVLSVLAGAQDVGKSVKADLPTPDNIRLYSEDKEESKGEMRYLRRNAKIQTSDFVITADEIDYNSDTNWANARGHVRLEHFITGEKLQASSARYNLETQNGKFYNVSGTAPAKIVASPTVLTTTNPFYFAAAYADRIKSRYILHQGWLTDCSYIRPWWRFQSPTFDVIPGERAIAHNAVFRLRGVPLLYLPYFYRPLGKKDRQSGFLTPQFGNSSLYGFIVGEGYYWAISRSFDMTAFGQYYTDRGPALRYDFRGKPNSVTDFDFNYYGVLDSGYDQANGNGTTTKVKQGGQEFQVTARTQVLGFTGQLNYTYLSSYLFRQAFSYSITSSVLNQIDSSGYLQRRFQADRYTLNIGFQRTTVYNSITQLYQTQDREVLQKLPSVEFLSRDQNLTKGAVPLWWSLDSSAGAVSRLETLGGTREVDSGAMFRSDIHPRVMTALQWKGFSLAPSAAVESTTYSETYGVNSTTYVPTAYCGGYQNCSPTPITNVAIANNSLWRRNADFTTDFRVPTLQRIYTPPHWLHLGTKLKHVVELDAKYEYLTGIDNFSRVIRVDSRDILANTNQLTISFTNRFYRKDKNGKPSEVIRWRVSQARFFDPNFGGAVLPGQRNTVLSAVEFSPFAFLDGPRNYSPVSSTLTFSPGPLWSFDWRTDYDPLRGKFVDQSVSGTFRKGRLALGAGETAVTTDPLLVPQANQVSFNASWGSANRKGWNASAFSVYDVLINQRLFTFVQTSYNTDCCGFAVQLRQINIGLRSQQNGRAENQYLFSFSLANIGSFGTLSKQTRLF